jgi:hypothetical protein
VTRAPGSPIRVVLSKWGGRPHWEFDAVYLGSDDHGEWCGLPGGTVFVRPGAEYVAPVDQAMLVPAADADDRFWIATFHATGGQVEVYVDMTTPPEWEGPVLRAVDLDLDVVRGLTGRVWIDDEDEFAEHRVAFDYPDEVVAHALASAERVRTAVVSRRAPFDGTTHRAWLDRFAAAGAGRPGAGPTAGSRGEPPPA